MAACCWPFSSGAAEDLLRNIDCVVKLDGDAVGYLFGKVAEIKRRKVVELERTR
jgi:hypothetical protein